MMKNKIDKALDVFLLFDLIGLLLVSVLWVSGVQWAAEIISKLAVAQVMIFGLLITYDMAPDNDKDGAEVISAGQN